MKVSSSVQYDHIRGEFQDGKRSNMQIYKCGSVRMYLINDHRADNVWFIRKDNDFTNMIIDLPQVPVLKDLSEEEEFQLSLVWDYDIPMELVKSIQHYSSVEAEKIKHGKIITTTLNLVYDVYESRI